MKKSSRFICVYFNFDELLSVIYLLDFDFLRLKIKRPNNYLILSPSLLLEKKYIYIFRINLINENNPAEKSFCKLNNYGTENAVK